MAVARTPVARRRARRGSLERPIDGRLYRSAFLVLSLPLLILAFSVTRPGALPAPLLPPNFDGIATRQTRDQLIRQVLQGGGNMPAYGKNLSPAEVNALVAFMGTLRP